MSIKMTAAVLAAMVGGAAQAAPELQVTRDEWSVRAVWDTGFESGPARELFEMTDEALVTNPVSLSRNWVSDPDDTGDILNEVATSMNFDTTFDSSSGFSIQSALTSRIDMSAPLDIFAPDAAENYGESAVYMGGQIRFNLTEDASVRIRINGSNMFSDSLIGDLNHELSFEGPSLASTSFGIGDDDANFFPDFDQVLELAAGEYRFRMSHEALGDHFTQIEGFEMISTLGVSFEIVPAPGGAALFGMGGLVAARRRR